MVDLPTVLTSETPLSALQWYNRRKCADAPRDLAATADLPHHRAFFSLQLLDLPHRWYEWQDNNIHIFDVPPLAATVYIMVKMNPVPSPDPLQPARSLADLLTAIARLFGRRPRDAPSLHTWWTIQQIVTGEHRILEVSSYELATPTPAAQIEIFEQRLSLWH